MQIRSLLVKVWVGGLKILNRLPLAVEVKVVSILALAPFLGGRQRREHEAVQRFHRSIRSVDDVAALLDLGIISDGVDRAASRCGECLCRGIANVSPEVGDAENDSRSGKGRFERGSVVHVGLDELDALVRPGLA